MIIHNDRSHQSDLYFHLSTTMYRTAALSVIALVACSFAAPVLQRGARQATSVPNQIDLMGTMRSGLRVLQEFSKYNLSKTLMINASLDVFNSNTIDDSHKEIQEALNTTCKLYEARKTLNRITLDDDTAYNVLLTMSEKSLEDACTWTSTTLRNADSSYIVECSNSSLTDLCSQWNNVVSIKVVEDKVDKLVDAHENLVASINETVWINDLSLGSDSPLSEFFSEIFGCDNMDGKISCEE